MNLPYWIEKTISGSLACIFCGSLVIQVGGAWLCMDSHCEKHHDIPAEEQPVSNYWNYPIAASGTSISPSPSPEITDDFIEGG